MRILDRSYCHNRNVHTVELTPEENEWPDDVLITTADNYGNSEWAWKSYRNRTHPGHFGGVVSRQENLKAIITVYID